MDAADIRGNARRGGTGVAEFESNAVKRGRALPHREGSGTRLAGRGEEERAPTVWRGLPDAPEGGRDFSPDARLGGEGRDASGGYASGKPLGAGLWRRRLWRCVWMMEVQRTRFRMRGGAGLS